MKSDITARERQVLKRIWLGYSNKEIADQLTLSVRTVEVHRNNLMKKWGTGNTAQLLRTAFKKRLIYFFDARKESHD